MSEPSTTQAHTGPIKTPKQLLIAGLLSFVVPIFAIIGLVAFVSSANRPSAGAANPERGVELRIQKVGTVDIRDANRPLKSGEEVYLAQCVACHGTGAAGAPKFKEAGAWETRIKSGYEALLHSALNGKGAMAPQGGGDFNDTEIGRAVVYMANAAGSSFEVPSLPSAATNAEATAAPQTAPAAMPTSVIAPTGSTPAVAAVTHPMSSDITTVASVGGVGDALYKQACQVCHAAGVAGAPKFGDQAAWAPRLATGMEALYKAAIGGMGAMPPRGGTSASDADIRAAVDYMVAAAK